MLKIIYEDNDKIIVDKKAGQLSQSGKSMDLDLVSEILNYRKRKKEEPYAAIINRLDRPVAGLVLIAKNKEAAARYSWQVQAEGGISKVYEAYVYGRFNENSGRLKDYLVHDKVNNLSYVADESEENAKEAVLDYEVMNYDEDNNVSQVRIYLITGRHHQIRTQLSNRGHVILGDYKYMVASGIESSQMDVLVRKYRIRRNTIALAAVELKIDGKKFVR